MTNRLLSTFVSLSFAALALLANPARAQDEKILQLGRETFTSCSLCHGPDGKGAKAGDILMAPSLHESPFVKSKAEPLIAVILKGIHKEDNKYLQVMVPLEEALSDEQIAAVTTYVRSEFAGKNNVIEPKYVKKVRKDYRSRSESWKRGELEQMKARAESGPIVSNLRYSIYPGKWEELPDFSTLKPAQSGIIDNNKISLNVVENTQRAFGAVFEGDLKLKYSDDYEFAMWALNRGALIVDGENMLVANGENASEITTATEKLEAGQHTFKVHYLFNGGKARLALSMKSKTLGEINFADRAISKGEKKDTVYPPIILTPENGEAIVHRAFLPNEKPRAIAVGYPGGLSLSWNGDTLNLSTLWRGGFLDVSPHWNHRGSSSQPVGEGQLAPATGMPFQILKSPDDLWQPFSEAKIAYERDTANPKEQITFDIEHPDYNYVGYRLGGNRYPTFYYQYRNLEITDTFEPGVEEGHDAIVRTVTIHGQPEENVFFRLTDQASAQPGAETPGTIQTKELAITLEGAEPITRSVGGKSEMLARITEPTELRIRYRWLKPRKPVAPSPKP